MNIIVCIKVVSSELVYQDTLEHDKYTINPYDLLALQNVVKLKEKGECNVSCISMGGDSIKYSLVRSMALGADDVYWLKDDVFACSDTVATTYILSEGIKNIDRHDLIVCGAESVDGETGQVVFGLAERLNIPCITDVEEVIDFDDEYVVVKATNNEYCDTLKVKLPVLISFKEFTIVSKKISLIGLKHAQRKTINIWNIDDLKLDKAQCGIEGSRTKVLKVKSDFNKKNGERIFGDSKEKVDVICQLIQGRTGGK